MVDYQTKIRNKLQAKVFDTIGKTVTLISKSSPTYNSRGEIENVTETSSSVVIVPYNIMHEEQSYKSFGDLNEGDMDAAVPYDVTIAINDVFEIESERWLIKAIERNYLPGNVVNIVRLTREH